METPLRSTLITQPDGYPADTVPRPGVISAVIIIIVLLTAALAVACLAITRDAAATGGLVVSLVTALGLNISRITAAFGSFGQRGA